jgi:hypothetical protein
MLEWGRPEAAQREAVREALAEDNHQSAPVQLAAPSIRPGS